MGRRSSYNVERADRICAAIAVAPYSLAQLYEELRGEGWFPHPSTLYEWEAKYPEFADKFARAQVARSRALMEQTLEIADTPQEGVTETDKLGKEGFYTEVRRGDMLEHRKLRIYARQKYAAQLNPKEFGDKQQLEISGSISVTFQGVPDEDLIAELQELVATGVVKHLALDAIPGEVISAVTLPDGRAREDAVNHEDDPASDLY